jgi:hypothetical protein
VSATLPSQHRLQWQEADVGTAKNVLFAVDAQDLHVTALALLDVSDRAMAVRAEICEKTGKNSGAAPMVMTAIIEITTLLAKLSNRRAAGTASLRRSSTRITIAAVSTRTTSAMSITTASPRIDSTVALCGVNAVASPIAVAFWLDPETGARCWPCSCVPHAACGLPTVRLPVVSVGGPGCCDGVSQSLYALRFAHTVHLTTLVFVVR